MLIKKGSFKVEGFSGEVLKRVEFESIWNYVSTKGKNITKKDGMESYEYNGTTIQRDKMRNGTYVYYVNVKFDKDTPQCFIVANVSFSSDSKYINMYANSSRVKAEYIIEALNRVMF